MPSDVSFLSASRNSSKPITEIGGSKIKGLNAQALSQPYDTWESYLPTPSINNLNTETLQIPFGRVNSNNHVFKVSLDTNDNVPAGDQEKVNEMDNFRQMLDQEPNAPMGSNTETNRDKIYPNDYLSYNNQFYKIKKPQNSYFPYAHRNDFSFAIQNDDGNDTINNTIMDGHTTQYTGDIRYKLADFNNELRISNIVLDHRIVSDFESTIYGANVSYNTTYGNTYYYQLNRTWEGSVYSHPEEEYNPNYPDTHFESRLKEPPTLEQDNNGYYIRLLCFEDYREHIGYGDDAGTIENPFHFSTNSSIQLKYQDTSKPDEEYIVDENSLTFIDYGGDDITRWATYKIYIKDHEVSRLLNTLTPAYQEVANHHEYGRSPFVLQQSSRDDGFQTAEGGRDSYVTMDYQNFFSYENFLEYRANGSTSYPSLNIPSGSLVTFNFDFYRNKQDSLLGFNTSCEYRSYKHLFQIGASQDYDNIIDFWNGENIGNSIDNGEKSHASIGNVYHSGLLTTQAEINSFKSTNRDFETNHYKWYKGANNEIKLIMTGMKSCDNSSGGRAKMKHRIRIFRRVLPINADIHLIEREITPPSVNTKFLDDVVWEFSIFARALRPKTLLNHESNITYTYINHPDINYRISTVDGPLNSDDGSKRMHFQHQFDPEYMDSSQQRSRTAEIMIFGVDDSANAFFDGYNGVTINNSSVNGNIITHPKTGGTMYNLRREVVGGEWQLLRMYVKFTDPKITGITVRAGNRDKEGTRIIFAHPRLTPHNLSLQKVLGGINDSYPYIPTPTDFSFGDKLG
jgi:hypothetical protein